MNSDLRRVALGLFALACPGLAAPRNAAAAPETAVFREIPTRFEVAGQREEDPGRTVAEGTPVAELGRIVRSREPLQRRVDAVRRLDAFGDNRFPTVDAYYDYVETLTRTADWLLSSEGDPHFRRFAVFILFAQAYTFVGSHLPFHPGVSRLWAFWNQVEKLRGLGLNDKDRRLEEYFERYVPLAQAPAWKLDEDRMHRATESIIKALPQHAARLRERLRQMDEVTAAQLKFIPGYGTDLAPGLPPALRAQFIDVEGRLIAYRLHTAWASNYAGDVITEIGAEQARRFGVVQEEVRLGWPAYPASAAPRSSSPRR